MKKIFNTITILTVLILLSGCGIKNRYDSLDTKSLKDIKVIKKQKNKTLGIAFGGGGVRGFAHLGVIKALEEEGIKADIVTGTSAGSIAASLYASGMRYEEIEKKVLNLGREDIGDLTLFSKGGLIQGKKLAKWIQKSTNNMKIEDAKIKLGITATDLTNHKSLLIIKGDTGEAVQASSTIPGAFVPVISKENILVDGGILSLVPVKFNKALGADVVLGVDVYCGKIKKAKESMIHIMVSVLRVQSCKLSEYEINDSDFIIRPKYEPKNYRNFNSKEESIKMGYEETKKILPSLKQKLGI